MKPIRALRVFASLLLLLRSDQGLAINDTTYKEKSRHKENISSG
jgi:hypothetical protein